MTTKLSPFELVRQHIISLYRKSGNRRNIKISERKLAEELGVSRMTARKGIKSLQDDGFLQVKPRKCSHILMDNASKSPHVGIVIGSGLQTIITKIDSLMLARALTLLAEKEFHISIIQRDCKQEKAAEQLQEMNLDGLLWFMPWEQTFHTIRILIDEKFPVSLMSPSRSTGFFNAIETDFAANGIQLARYFLKRGHEKIAYCGMREATYKSFVKELKKHGVDYDESLCMAEPEDINQYLPELLNNNKITALHSDGDLSRFERVLPILSNSNAKPDLTLDYYAKNFRQLLTTYNQIKVSKIIMPDYKKIVGNAVENLVQMLGRKNASPTFENVPPVFVKLKDALCKTSSL